MTEFGTFHEESALINGFVLQSSSQGVQPLWD